MKLPNGDTAVIEIAKLTDYCLNQSHPRGKHKARVFESVLGLTAKNAEHLRTALAAAARNENASIGSSDLYGTRYIIDFTLKRDGLTATIRSCWIIRNGEIAPRFVTCFVL